MSLNAIADSVPTTKENATGQLILSGMVSSVLFLLACAVYWPACSYGFLEWDDQLYVYEQPRVLGGISLEGIRWAMTANVAGNWHPLTLISLQLDAQLFGPEPSGFHRTAVLLHAVNSVLAYLTVLALTGCRWRSAVCGFLFALHPMRVESVAWISERKDQLSGFFFFLTVLAYVRYVRAPSLARYLPVFICLALGLSSKTILVTTPCVLLLLDFWPLGRFRGFGVNDWRAWLRLVCEKLPLLALSFIASGLTLTYQRVAMWSFDELTMAHRLVNAAESYMAYLSQSFWPVGLSPLYQIADRELAWTPFLSAASVLVAVTAIAIWQRKQRPYLLVGWLWFVGMLVPVIGLYQAGLQSRADRYMYLSQLGLYLAVVWWVSDLADRIKFGWNLAVLLAAVVIVGCARVTTQQIPVWRNNESLWQCAIHVDPPSSFAIRRLTKHYIDAGKHAELIRLGDDAIRIRELNEVRKLIWFISYSLEIHGDEAGAIAVLNKALVIHRDYPEWFSNRGKAFAALGEWQSAADDFRAAAKLAPREPLYPLCLAHALFKSGDQSAADEIYAEAVRQFPDGPRKAAKLSWKMSTNPEREPQIKLWAVQLAELANEATGKSRPEFLDALAAAYADAGQFNDAVSTADLAADVAINHGKAAFAEQIRRRRELYLSGNPYRESTQRPREGASAE